SCCPQVERLEERCLLAGDAVMDWNAFLMQAEANDFNPSIVQTPDQAGPTKAARALAIVHAGIYDAVNSIDGKYTPYLAKIPNAKGASIEAATAQAAHDTMVAMFPHQKALMDDELTAYLAGIPNGFKKTKGIAVGKAAASNILANRVND